MVLMRFEAGRHCRLLCWFWCSSLEMKMKMKLTLVCDGEDDWDAVMLMFSCLVYAAAYNYDDDDEDEWVSAVFEFERKVRSNLFDLICLFKDMFLLISQNYLIFFSSPLSFHHHHAVIMPAHYPDAEQQHLASPFHPRYRLLCGTQCIQPFSQSSEHTQFYYGHVPTQNFDFLFKQNYI